MESTTATTATATAKLCIYGDTYEIRELLKKNGFRWNKSGSWWEKEGVTEKQAKAFNSNIKSRFTDGTKDLYISWGKLSAHAAKKSRANMTAKERRELDANMEDFHS